MNPRIIYKLFVKNLKYRFREPQQYLFVFGFPVGFTLIFWLVFKGMPLPGLEGRNQFDIFIWGLLSFVIAFGTQSASMSFSQEKDKQTLDRLMTTPIKTADIFIGFLLSEVVAVAIQVLTVYIIAFGILGTYFSSWTALLINFLMYVVGGLFCIGLGLILAALLKPKLAMELPMIVVMPITMLSGIFVPFDSKILYINPFFWISVFTKEVGFADKGLDELIGWSDFSGNVITTEISLGWAVPITIFSAVVFLGLGIILFGRKLKK